MVFAKYKSYKINLHMVNNYMVAMAMAPKEDSTLKSYTVDLGGDDEKTLPRMQRSVKLREDSHTICLSMRELVDPTDV